jgi:hypothetical protein
MLGRVSAIFLAVNTGARPIGASLGGFIGLRWGAPACLVVAFVGFVIQAWVIFGSTVPALKSLPTPAP